MKQLRRWYWYVSLYVQKHTKTFFLALVAGILLFALLLPILTKLPQIKKTTYVGIIGNYSFSNLPTEIQIKMSRGLTKIAPDGSAIPDIVETWRVENDGKTYTFLLKEGIRWQDGKILEPSDIPLGFQDTEITTTDDSITFTLKDPFAPFPVVVSQPLFREVKTPYLRFFQRRRIIGLGTFRLTSIKYKENRIDELILDSDSERYIYRFYLTEDRAKTAFKRGNIDIIEDVSNIQDLGQWPNVVTTQHIQTDQYTAIFFNQNDPLFQKNIRQALAYAIEKADGELRALGPIDENSWAYLEGVKTYPFDQQRAIERLLDEIPSQALHFTLTTTANFQQDAEEIKRQWEELGILADTACQRSSAVKDKNQCANLRIQVTVNVSSFPDVNNYQALLIGERSPRDPDQYFLWHSTQNTNFTHYKNPRIDALLENGRKVTDVTERKAIYQEFQQFLLEDSPAIFLRHLVTYTIRRQ